MNEKNIEILNMIFSLATRDYEFRNKLFTEPVTTLEKFEISYRTKHVIINTIREILSQ